MEETTSPSTDTEAEATRCTTAFILRIGNKPLQKLCSATLSTVKKDMKQLCNYARYFPLLPFEYRGPRLQWHPRDIRKKCHCNQIVTETRDSLVTNQSFGTCSKSHCKCVVSVNGEICNWQMITDNHCNCRVTHHVVSNLPLTTKQKLHFSAWASYWNATFVLISTRGWKQRDVLPCTSKQSYYSIWYWCKILLMHIFLKQITWSTFDLDTLQLISPYIKQIYIMINCTF